MSENIQIFFGEKDNFHNQFTSILRLKFQNCHFRESPKVLRKAPTRRLRLWAYLICEGEGNISIISCRSLFIQTRRWSIPIVSSAILMVSASTWEPCFENPIVSGRLKSIFGLPQGADDDCLTFLAFQVCTTSFNSFWITGRKQKISVSLCASRPARYIPSWNICWKNIFHHDKQNFFKRAQKASIRWFLTDAPYLNFLHYLWIKPEDLPNKYSLYLYPFLKALEQSYKTSRNLDRNLQ